MWRESGGKGKHLWLGFGKVTLQYVECVQVGSLDFFLSSGKIPRPPGSSSTLWPVGGLRHHDLFENKSLCFIVCAEEQQGVSTSQP